MSTKEGKAVQQSTTSALNSGNDLSFEFVTDIRQIKSVSFQPLPGSSL